MVAAVPWEGSRGHNCSVIGHFNWNVSVRNRLIAWPLLIQTASHTVSFVFYCLLRFWEHALWNDFLFSPLLSGDSLSWVEPWNPTPAAVQRKSFYVMFLNIWKLRNKATNITALKKYTAKDMTTHCSWGLQKISSLIVMARAATERFDMVKKHWYISPQHGLTGLNLSLRVNITQLMADTSITVSYLW